MEGTPPKTIREPVQLPVRNELMNRQTNVLRDLAEQRRRDVSSFVERDRCAATIRVTVLDVGATLTDRDKTQPFKHSANLGWL